MPDPGAPEGTNAADSVSNDAGSDPSAAPDGTAGPDVTAGPDATAGLDVTAVPGSVGADGRLLTALLAPVAALTLLTITPVDPSVQRRIGAREVAAAAPWFPLVGVLLGALAGGAADAAVAGGSAVLGAAVGGILIVLLTGALHLDGLADSADALGARGGLPARRLEIMRDSATGVYGAAAIGSWLLLTVAAIATVPADQLVLTLAWCLACARTAGVLHAAILPSARAIGLGAGFGITAGRAVAALVVTAGIGVLIALADQSGSWLSGPGPRAVYAVAGTTLVAGALVSLLAIRLLRGRTGDTIGATIALSEATALLAAALVLA